MNTKQQKFMRIFGLVLILLLSACSGYKGEGILYNVLRARKILWLFDAIDVYALDPTGPKIYSESFSKELNEAHEAAVSPDGKWIAFSAGGRAAGEPGSDIYISDRMGEKTFRITDASGSDRNPSWSPDGKQILYDSDRNGDDYLVDQDITCILNNEPCSLEPNFLVEGRNPDWSPDGEGIVYERLANHTLTVYAIVEAKAPIALTPPEMECWAPRWSPDGDKIAISCWMDNSIYIVNKDGSEFTSLGIQGIRPEWSIDGEKLYFLSDDAENLGKMIGWENCSTNALFMLDFESRKVERLTWGKNECIFWYTLLPATQ